MQQSKGEPGFYPLEEIYLSRRLQSMRGLAPGNERPSHQHFTLREGAGLSIMQMLDEQEHHARPAGATSASAAATASGQVYGEAASVPETDMFMGTNPVKENVTIAGLGTIGRVDSRRAGGRMKQLDIDEAIAAENLSRQMSDAGNLTAKTPRAHRHSSQTGEDPGPYSGGVMMDTAGVGTVNNPFFSGEGFVPAAGSAPMHLPPVKRGREWELAMEAEAGQAHAPLLKDTLADLGDEEGEQDEGNKPGNRQGDGSGGVNYF
mmetsp:Transcript_29063/g.81900  ORF Transcript_29063/g.81900 Transcript_29063/m.81900 type:complete len:262 (-) Transcript_29063:235-1020(-)